MLFACPVIQQPDVVKAATDDALAELCSEHPELCDEHSAPPDGTQPVPMPTGSESTAELREVTARLGKLEQQVRVVLDAQKADNARARDKDLVKLPSFASLRSQVEGHSKRLKSTEASLETSVPKKIEDALKALRTEITTRLKTLEKDVKAALAGAQKAESAVRGTAATIESHTSALADIRARLGALETASVAPNATAGALVDELEQRLVSVERVIDGMRALLAPAASAAPEPAAVAGAAPETAAVTAAATPARAIPARGARGDGALEVERIRAARALRREAAAVVGRIGSPDHFIVDGHNVVVEPLKSGSFESERDARSWLITQMVALADALDLPDVRIMFDTPDDTQYPESASDRVSVQFCGPDSGKADGKIIEVIQGFRTSDTVVVCSSDHKHVWADIESLAADGHRVYCVERFPVFELMQAIERYLAAYEDLPVETRMVLVREELEEVAALVAPSPSAEPVSVPAEGPVASEKQPVSAKPAAGGAAPSPSVVPAANLSAWQEALARGDFDAAEAELARAEHAGARHPYLTLAQSATHLARGNADAALEVLTRFDYDPYAGPNMRVQVGLIRLLAHAEGIDRVVEPEDIMGVLAAQGVTDFDISRGSLGIYLASLNHASDVLRRSVEVISAELAGVETGRAAAPGQPAHAPETDRELLRRAGSALAEGRTEDAARLYDLIETQGVSRHHAYVNRAMVELARGRISAATDPIEQYAQLAATPMMRLQAVVLQQLARALDGDASEPADVALARERVDVFQAHLSPIWYLARCLRRGGASPEVESILAAAGF